MAYDEHRRMKLVAKVAFLLKMAVLSEQRHNHAAAENFLAQAVAIEEQLG